MPRGMGRGNYRRYGYGGFFRGTYGILDVLLLLGIIYLLVKLFIAAAPYALALVALLVLREMLGRPRW